MLQLKVDMPQIDEITTTGARRVLYVEDNPAVAQLFQIELQKAGYVVDLAATGAEGLARLVQQHYDLVALDQDLPFCSGMQILQILASHPSSTPVIMISSPEDTESMIEAIRLGASDYLFKGRQDQYLQILPAIVERTLEMHRLEREREQTLEELRQHNRNLILLNRVTHLITSTLDIGEVIKQLVETMTELIEVEGTSVWLLDEQQDGRLVCAAIYSQGQSITPAELSLPPEQGIAGWVVKYGESTTVDDVATDKRFSSTIDHSTGFNTQSILAVPLRTPHKVVGVLELVNKQRGKFQENDRVLAETLAASAAIAIENARLMQTFRQNRDELQARNEELDAYAHTVAHDLKNPLTMIIGFADLLRDNFDSLPADNITTFLETIIEHGLKMSSIIDTLLRLAGVRGADQVKLEEVNMGDVVAETLKRMKHMMKEHNAEVTVPDSWPIAKGYGPWLEEVWFNYLSNALKYGGDPPHLELGANVQKDGMIRFWVKDNGAGMRIENVEALFSPSTTPPSERRRSSHGLGLSIVQRIIRKLNGIVGAESKPGNGSTFYFALPPASLSMATPPVNSNQ